MQYELRLASTASGVGYYAGIPKREGTFDEHLAYLRKCPLDDFMHRHLLEMLVQLDEQRGRGIFELARARDHVVLALLYEAALTCEHLRGLKTLYDNELIRSLVHHTPLRVIKSSMMEDRELHAGWMRLFERNLFLLEPLPPPEGVSLPVPFTPAELRAAAEGRVSLATIQRPVKPGAAGAGPPTHAGPPAPPQDQPQKDNDDDSQEVNKVTTE